MSSYDVEHSVPASDSNTNGATSRTHERRPDFSTFFSHLSSQTDTSDTVNPHAHALPSDISAAYRLLAEGFEQMRQGQSGAGVLDVMIDALLQESTHPPDRVKGVGQEFIDGLDRVSRKSLKKDMDCPICGNGFLEDEYPLVVRLPCNPKHLFDLECIAPWLKLNATCPLDRKELVKPPAPAEKKTTGNRAAPASGSKVDEEEEWDDMYA